MSRVARILWMPLLLVAICGWLAFEKAHLGEWTIDAGTAVEDLAGGHVSAYFSQHPMLGPLATLFQTPFALLGNSSLGRYQWATFGSLLVTAGIGWYLGRVATELGAGRITRVGVPVLFLANPLTFEALNLGHPEEPMTAALVICAIVLAWQGRSWQSGLALGLAIATKQWSALAIFPVLMALPARRALAAGVAGAVAALLSVPWAIANSGSFLTTQGAGAEGGRIATIWSVWRPLSSVTELHLATSGAINSVHRVPASIQPWTHLLIIAAGAAIPLALWAWRREFHLEPERAIALFALIMLLRCALDPNDNLYYHLPVLMALVAWDALAPERLPIRSVAGTAIALLFYDWSRHLGSLELFNLAYVAVVIAVAAAFAASLLCRDRPRPVSLRPRRRVTMAAGRA